MKQPNRKIKTILILAGVFYTLTGFALFFAPAWFLENIGPYYPFNRHYMGDLAAFLLPMGVGLLLAAPAPQQHRLLIGVVAAGNVLHGLNHLYDAIQGRETLAHWLTDTLPLILFAILYLWAINDVIRERQVTSLS
ncbi:MAG: hypothetical protein AAF614_12705 [Chloroflexota bacterium]